MPSSREVNDQFTEVNLSWKGGEPFSFEFDDVYFAKGHGLEESQYVFLQKNDLYARVNKLLSGEHFSVAETGFGTGLNFLALCELWDYYAPKGAKLHFISSEKYPLSQATLKKAHSLFPEMQKYSEQLLSIYPEVLYNGQSHYQLTKDISLTLLIGDSLERYRAFEGVIDAWFLDGFAPNKNPDMWQEALFDEIWRLSHTKTTLATFTAASRVRKSLQRVGFRVTKHKGFGCKREMLSAVVSHEKSTDSHCAKYLSVTHSISSNPIKKAAVIGAGLAGASVCYELSKLGIKAELYDKSPSFAMGASGNPYGILKPYLTADCNLSDQFHTSGYLYTKAILQEHHNKIDYIQTGAIELFSNEKEKKRYQHIFNKRSIAKDLAFIVSKEKASEIANIPLEHAGVYYPQAVMVNPKSLIETLLIESKAKMSFNYSLEDCQYQHKTRTWQLCFNVQGARVEKEYDAVVFAGSFDLMEQIAMLNFIEAYRSFGQISITKKGTSVANNKCILIAKGYLLPYIEGTQLFGASFRDNSDTNDQVEDSDHLFNIAQIVSIVNTGIEQIGSARVSARCVTSDHLPLVGNIADKDQYAKQYALALNKGGRLKSLDEAQYYPNIYLSSGFGSKGLCSMFISARHIANLIHGNPNLTLSSELFQALHPMRFMARSLKKRR